MTYADLANLARARGWHLSLRLGKVSRTGQGILVRLAVYESREELRDDSPLAVAKLIRPVISLDKATEIIEAQLRQEQLI